MLHQSMKFMKDMIEAVEEEPQREAPSTIYRVLKTIREQDTPAYEPKIIPIGPFHQGSIFDQRNRLLLPVERLKWRFLRDLILRHPNNTLEKYINHVTYIEEEARKCYSETPASRDEFLAIMVLDGCFIIEFLAKTFHGMEHNVQRYFEHWDLRLLKNDLLLLENQIPFLVLQCLFDSTVIPSLPSDLSLKELAVKCFTTRTDFLHVIPDVVHHLLHLFHSCLRPSPVTIGSLCTSWSVLDSFFWLLSLIVNCRRPPPPVKGAESAPRMIPRATELDESGVKFVIKKDARSFLDVTFKNGTMEIPLLPVEPLTVSFFRNLVAFERCREESERHITSYAALMDSLIDKPEDVALLERSGVMQNMLLGGAEEMVRFYNSLGKGAYIDYENHYMVGLFKEVRKYYGTGRHRWRVRLVRNFAMLAFVLLVLNIVQTIFTIYGCFTPQKSKK